MKKSRLIGVFIFSLFLASCGIEDFPVIPPIPQSNIDIMLNTRAIVHVPNHYDGTPFTNFAVYYRIYVSDVLLSTSDTSSFSTINSALASDYNSFSTYIDSTTVVNVDMDRLFLGRRYRALVLQNSNISSVLSSSVHGSQIVFDFSSSRAPIMTIGSNSYTLWRSDGGGLFNPQPDRLFFNREELYKSDNINDTTNADVAAKSGVTDGRLYTYAAMFIVAVGINATSYSNIYSTPALINVFLLPDRW